MRGAIKVRADLFNCARHFVGWSVYGYLGAIKGRGCYVRKAQIDLSPLALKTESYAERRTYFTEIYQVFSQ